MTLSIIFLLLSLAVTGSVYYFTRLYEMWYYFFVPILMIPLCYILIFFVYIIILFIVSLFVNKKKDVNRPHKIWYFWVRQTVRQIFLLSNTKVKIIGKEKLDKKKKYLVISNHISNFDPMCAIGYLKLDPLICITKKENLKIPICGSFIHKAGFIDLDREDNHSAVYSIRKAVEFMDKYSCSIFVCPEGTRSKTKELLPFHAGTFKIATKADVDIVVCYVENTDQIVHRFPFKRTRVTMKVVDILKKEDIQAMRTMEIAELSRNIIQKEKENKRV